MSSSLYYLLKSGAKVQQNLRMCKKIAIFFAIFSLEDARVASYSLGFKGMLCPNTIRKNKQRQETFLGEESTFLGSNLKKSVFLEAGSWVALLSVFSRSSVGVLRQGIREVKESAILTNSTFWWLGVLRFILGSSLVRPWSFTRSRYVRYNGRKY